MKIKLNLLKDTLDKKAQALSQILAITENQENMLVSNDKCDAAKSIFRETTAEKQKLIDEVLQADAFFQNIFDEVGQYLEADSQFFKEQIALLQGKIKEVTELDIKIRLQEQKNRQLVSKEAATVRFHTPKASKNHLLEQYKKNKEKPKF